MSTIQIHCSYSKLVDYGELLPNASNPKIHTPDQIALLAKIIEHTGFRLPVVVSNLSGLIVAGHGRYLAAGRLKMEQVPVDYQDFASEEDELAHLLADNRMCERAENNPEKLKEMLLMVDGMTTEDFDIEYTGFHKHEVELLMTAVGDEGQKDAADIKELVCPKCGHHFAKVS